MDLKFSGEYVSSSILWFLTCRSKILPKCIGIPLKEHTHCWNAELSPQPPTPWRARSSCFMPCGNSAKSGEKNLGLLQQRVNRLDFLLILFPFNLGKDTKVSNPTFKNRAVNIFTIQMGMGLISHFTHVVPAAIELWHHWDSM